MEQTTIYCETCKRDTFVEPNGDCPGCGRLITVFPAAHMGPRTYSIIRSRRTATEKGETVLATGLGWEAADTERNRLTTEEAAAKPLETSWTRDVFIVRLEPKEGASK